MARLLGSRANERHARRTILWAGLIKTDPDCLMLSPAESVGCG